MSAIDARQRGCRLTLKLPRAPRNLGTCDSSRDWAWGTGTMHGHADNMSLKSHSLPRKSWPARSQVKAPRSRQQACASTAWNWSKPCFRKLTQECTSTYVIVRLRVTSQVADGRLAQSGFQSRCTLFAYLVPACGFAVAVAGEFNGFENKLALDSKGQLGRAKDLETWSHIFGGQARWRNGYACYAWIQPRKNHCSASTS